MHLYDLLFSVKQLYTLDRVSLKGWHDIKLLCKYNNTDHRWSIGVTRAIPRVMPQIGRNTECPKICLTRKMKKIHYTSNIVHLYEVTFLPD